MTANIKYQHKIFACLLNSDRSFLTDLNTYINNIVSNKDKYNVLPITYESKLKAYSHM